MRNVALLVAALALVGCFDDDEPNAPNYTFEIDVTPTAIENLLQDDFVELDAVITNVTLDQVVADQRVALISEDPDVAEAFYFDVDDDEETPDVPIVVGVGEGTTTITARFRGASVEIPVSVEAVPITAGSITADRTTAFVGEEIELTTAFEDAEGNPIDRAVDFESSNEDVAEVDADGVVTITGPGAATITATSDGFEVTIDVTGELRAVARVVVDPDPALIEVGATQAFTARFFAANGEELSDRDVVWSTSNAGLATVNAETGVATGVAPTGSNAVLITATSEGVSGSARLLVDPAAP